MGPGAAQRWRHAPRALSPAQLTVAAWLVGLLVTGLILGTPYFFFGYRNPGLHLVLDSVDGCVALLVAYLVFGRYLRSDLLRDLLLAQGLALLGLAGLGTTVLEALLPVAQPETLEVWLPIALRTLAALLLLGAALAGRDHAPRPWRMASRFGPWLLAGAVVVLLVAVGDLLPPALEATPPASAARPVITGHPLLLLAQGVGALSFGIGSVVFARQAAQRPDPLLVALGPAFALGALARVNYVLFPSLYSDWLYTGDLLRTACYLVLLVGAAREISHFWSAQARAAVLEDRRRLARELHDGVVQELGFIRSEAQRLGAEPEGPGRILAACDRALDESRAAIDALGRASDQPLSLLLHQTARQVVERYGGRLDVDLDDAVVVDAEQRHALIRIAREAVSNALRHGRASKVSVRLLRDSQGRRLVVQDDGAGFDVGAAQRGTGYGLTSMRDRAAALPGTFELVSEPGRGTQVEVSW